MNGIGRDFFEAKPLCCFLAVDLHKQINGGLSIPFFSWIGIDVVHHFPDFFFRVALFRLIQMQPIIPISCSSKCN